MKGKLLLETYLERLRLPAMLASFEELARQAVQANQSHEGFLLALAEQEIAQREQNALKTRVKNARFPVHKSLDQFDFSALPHLNKAKVVELAQGSYIEKRENVILLGNSGTGKTHLATALGVSACEIGYRVRFFTAAGLINGLLEAQAALRLSHLERALARTHVLILDEVGYVPFSEKGAQLLFQTVSAGYERQSLVLTSNLEFSQWPQMFGSEQLTGALLDRLTHHAHIITMNGESYRFKESMKRKEKS